ncbi:MAG: endonuclease VIII, partial [Acetatifactor sp.]|nr:endonuclease VIII [Acetatifactor sp.]
MLEIPESRTIAAQMNETIQGKRILEVETAHTPHSFAWYSGEPAFYAEIMEGREIGRSESIGSMIELRLGDYSFVAGDGTNVRYFAPGEKLPGKYQTRITLEDDSNVVCTVQMYGAMFLIQPDTYDNPYYLAGKRKPMPNTEDFTYAYFRQLFEEASGSLSIKAFLATEQRIPGVGNGVLQDILLAAGLHPKRKISGMTEEGRRRIYDVVQDTLEKMTLAGGRDTEKDF